MHIQLTVYAGNGMIVTCGLGPGKFTFQAAQIQAAAVRFALRDAEEQALCGGRQRGHAAELARGAISA